PSPRARRSGPAPRSSPRTAPRTAPAGTVRGHPATGAPRATSGRGTRAGGGAPPTARPPPGTPYPAPPAASRAPPAPAPPPAAGASRLGEPGGEHLEVERLLADPEVVVGHGEHAVEERIDEHLHQRG